MTFAKHIEEAAEQLEKQAEAFAAANEALAAGDMVALMICLNAAAIHSGRCGYRLLDAMEELVPDAVKAAKSLPVNRLQ